MERVEEEEEEEEEKGGGEHEGSRVVSDGGRKWKPAFSLFICAVRGISANVLQLQDINGPSRGDDFYLDRVAIITQAASGTGFRMRRLQFPIHAAFAMTINYSRARPRATWESTCLHPCSCTANSTSACQGLAVLMPSKCWRLVESHVNVVYPEAL
ncbi:hypothetical protein GWK47_014755 [Chionoecetes opilio]|uniref:Uncharacterized protein n=1 Tax=Chionoecetes opilio TaxID=41210 RepID=A0A8J4XXY5_CHIOP|nr:hypothetical protein GWK47_014755 [Chionoecetes opilio]